VTFADGRLGALLNARPLAFIGALSYSLYLWQQPFLNRASASVLTAFPVNVVLAVALALLSYYLIEQPALRLRRVIEDRLRARRALKPTSGIVYRARTSVSE
jgi:peptidoglycan/LPS O-acetylase OafA/YrhL